jgi:tetratricopeptide (TPR) repeat protein
MISDAAIMPLRIANEAFMVAATIERCPRQMMLRELVMNALEAADQATDAPKRVRIDAVIIDNAPKLRIWNTGRGLSQAELLQISDLSSSLFKTVSLDGNFGMGAKAASLSSNKHGLRYRSCRLGKVSQILLGARGGVYGRVLQADPSSGERREAVDVTLNAKAAGEDLSHDWTEVTLLGNSPEQDTAADPYTGDPALPRDWVLQTLGRRFMRLPEGVELAIEPSASGAEAREIFTPSLAPSSFDRLEAVSVEGGVVIHYGYRAKDSALPLPRVNMIGVGAIVYDGEVYALVEGRRWALEAPTYGFTFAARQCSVIVELPHGFATRPEQYRQFLRFNEGDQHQVQFADFGEFVRRNLPAWLKRIIASLLPAESDYLAEIRDEMRHLLAELGIEDLLRAPQKPTPKEPDPNAPAEARESSPPTEARESPTSPKPPEVPSPPDIITIEDEADIVEKALGGRAARYYPAARQVFVNARYAAFARMRAQLADEFAPFADEETINRLAKLTSEWAIIQRIARTLLHSIGKPNSGWSSDEIRTAQSPETMSLMVDDIDPLLVPARRRMAAQLGVEADTSGFGVSSGDSVAQRAAGELAEAEAQLQRAMANDAPKLGWLYRQIASIHSRQRNSTAARTWIEKGVVADPADPWVRSEYVGLLMNDGDFDRAAQFADEALSLASNNPSWFRRRRAEVELRRGDRRKAEAMLKEMVAQDRADPWTHYDLAALYLEEGKLDAAAAAAEAALERGPQFAELAQRRADVELRRGDREAAKALYARAAALNPNNAWLRLPVAKLHSEERRFDEAVRELDAALALQPGAEASFHRLRSEIELLRGDRVQALVAAQRAISADPEDMWSQLHLSGVLLNIGDLDQAAVAAAAAERLAPAPSADVYRRQAEIEGRRNNHAGAVKILEQAIAAAPDDPWSWLGIAQHRSVLNDLKGAEEAARLADAKLTDAGRAHALRLRAQIARQRNDVAAAGAFLREAVHVAPGDPWSRLGLADHVFAEGDAEAALETLKPALPPHAPAIGYLLCRAAAYEERRKNWEAARNYIGQATATEPDNPQPWSALANILIAAGDLTGARAAAETAVRLASHGREAVAEEARESA